MTKYYTKLNINFGGKEQMTYTEKRLEFEEEVAKELGYVSALFMTQECKGTEIVMPTEELKEVVDRIGLYAFTSIHQAQEQHNQDCTREEWMQEKIKLAEQDQTERIMQYLWKQIQDDYIGCSIEYFLKDQAEIMKIDLITNLDKEE